MESYSVYKSTGIDWIGKIPEHWGIKKIKHRCYVKARVGWKGLKSDEFLNDGYAYLVTGSDFERYTVNWNECYHIGRERYDEDPYIQLENDDLLITKDGTIGKLAIVKNLDKPACLNSGIFVIRSTNNDFTTRYLFWVLMSESFKQFNEYTSYGSTIQHLYQNVFLEFAFAFPPKEEQLAIASYLEERIEEIDGLISEKEELKKLYEEEKATLIKKTVTKGLDPNVSFKNLDRGSKIEIPKSWQVSKLKFVADIQTGRTPKIKNSKIDFFENGNIDWFTPADFYQGNEIKNSKRKINDEAIEKNEAEIFPKFSIYLVSIGGTLGKISYCKKTASANQQINIISFKRSIINPLFGFYFLVGNKEMIKNEADFTTLPILNQTKTKNLRIFIPPKEEQENIVDYIENECSRIDKKVKRAEKLIALLGEYKRAMVNEVVTGKIKVVK